MSLDNLTSPPKQPTKDEAQISNSGGGNGTRKTSALKPPEQNLKCPRCDSSNTKFCYYNNYCLTQPRHFCKTCRRYWTKGGALRSVPIGGGCRKSKKTRPNTSRFINGGLNLLNGVSQPPMDFQLNRLAQCSSSTSINQPPFLNLDQPLGSHLSMIKHPNHHSLLGIGLANFQQIGAPNHVASSLESLSFLNQNLNWKLQQQQRLAAVLYGGRGGNNSSVQGGGGGGGIEIQLQINQQNNQQINQQNNQIVSESQPDQKVQPILFQNLEVPKQSQTSLNEEFKKDNGGLETNWFIDNNFGSVNADLTIALTNGNGAGNYENGSLNNWNNGIQGWDQFNQYNELP